MNSRRQFITGLVSFIAAPAIVRAGSLMPVKATLILPEVEIEPYGYIIRTGLPQMTWRLLNQGVPFTKETIIQ